MTDFQRLTVFGVMLNSALYLEACFMAGLFTQNGWAWRLAIAAMGATYFSYGTQHSSHWSCRYFLIASVALGVLAGLALLV